MSQLNIKQALQILKLIVDQVKTSQETMALVSASFPIRLRQHELKPPSFLHKYLCVMSGLGVPEMRDGLLCKSSPDVRDGGNELNTTFLSVIFTTPTYRIYADEIELHVLK